MNPQKSDESMRSEYYRAIYNECRKKISVTGHGTSAEDAARFIRESAVRSVTECTRPSPISDYKECTTGELGDVLAFLSTRCLPAKKYPIKEFMTAAQSKKLHNIALECALHYCQFGNEAQFTDESTGEIIWGEGVRQRAAELFRNNALSGAIMKYMYTHWINPKIHELLYTGNLRYQNRRPTATYYVDWKTLTNAEASHLIKCFNRMHNEIIERYSDKANVNQFLLSMN